MQNKTILSKKERLTTYPSAVSNPTASKKPVEVSTQRISYRDKRCLCDFLIRNTEHFRCFLFKVEMHRCPGCTQSSQTSGQHKTPYSRQNRSPDSGLLNAWLIVNAAPDAGYEQYWRLVHMLS